jgi:glycine/D-amino acid oxidase-like deaminating enzyme
VPTESPPFQQRVFWQTGVPRPRSEERPLPERADVVVVGGGYTGLTSALQLARAGARVTLLEKHALGWGASSRNGGMVHGGLRYSRDALRRRFGEELGERLHEDGREAFFAAERFIQAEAPDSHYERSGTLVLAWSRRHLKQLVEHGEELAADGLTARMVEWEDLHDEIGSDHYPGGLVIEESGGLDPARYVAALVDAAGRAGVDLHPDTPATRVQRRDGELRVETPRGTLSARDVILATNGYTDGLVPWLRQRIIPIGSYIIATEPLSEELAREISPRGRMFYDSKYFLYYWRLTPDRRLMFGGRASFTRTTVDQTAAILTRAMHEVHPQTRDLRVEYAWGGNVGFTFDQLPHLGERDGVHYGLGCCGSGVAMLTYFGLLLAQKVGAGTDTAREPSPFERIPHPGVPIVPAVYQGTPWFLPVVGEFFRLQDWWGRHGPLAG